MDTIMQVFGTLEASLLFICLVTFILGLILRRDWTDLIIPIYWAWWGTVLFLVLFVLSVVTHDHVNFNLK